MDNNEMNNEEMNNGEMNNSVQETQPTNQGGSNYRPAMEEAVSCKEWIITMIVLMIPCVNLIMIFVWAFSKSEKKSKSNYFKASLTVAAVALVICLVIVAIMGLSVLL